MNSHCAVEFASHNLNTRCLKTHNTLYDRHHNDMNETKKEHDRKREGNGSNEENQWWEMRKRRSSMVEQRVDNIMYISRLIAWKEMYLWDVFMREERIIKWVTNRKWLQKNFHYMMSCPSSLYLTHTHTLLYKKVGFITHANMHASMCHTCNTFATFSCMPQGILRIQACRWLNLSYKSQQKKTNIPL